MPIKQVKVKLCGLKTIDDVLLATTLGYDYLGFIINVPKSPRSITLEELITIHQTLVNKGLRRSIKLVGVFVDQDLASLNHTIEMGICDVIQLHGNEQPSTCNDLRQKTEIWKSLIKRSDQSVDDYLQLVKNFQVNVDKVLVDSASAQDKINCDKVKNYAEILKRIDFANSKLVLSGGINLNNIKDMLRLYQPEFIDLSSGVEEYPGKKDDKKVSEFINIINNYNGKN
jgi:phosphoribosylanthranilate isomerase